MAESYYTDQVPESYLRVMEVGNVIERRTFDTMTDRISSGGSLCWKCGPFSSKNLFAAKTASLMLAGANNPCLFIDVVCKSDKNLVRGKLIFDILAFS